MNKRELLFNEIQHVLNPFLADEGKADYIISGDRHLLSLNYKGIKILTAKEFIELVNSE
ncbi:MAG: hypothetical protein HXS48_10935 [Theionarchaea archaeon]|nr:hypothetical protein [Theionarchaea archaeon]